MKLITMAIRSLSRTPGFTAVAVVALALGIGANTAIFSIVNAVFLRALPYGDPQTLVQLTSSVPEQQLNGVGFSWPRLEAVMERQDVFDGMAVAAPNGWTVTGDGDPERIQGLQVSQSFFPLLGLKPVLGRTIVAEEDVPGAAPVALISHGYWERRMGARPDVLGESIQLDGTAHTIIGVMSKDASSFPMNQVAVWTARPKDVAYLVPVQIDNGGYFFNVFARLKPGTSIEQARQAVTTIASSYAQAHPTHVDAKSVAEVNFVLDGLVGNQRATYALLFGAVACLLLIAGANVANLVLARYAGRRKQIAIRFALGAKRRHVMAEFVAENVVLALVAGAVGLLLARWSLSLVTGLGANLIPRVEEISLDTTVVLFSLGVSLLTGLALGVLPALQVATPALTDALKESSRDSTGGKRQSRTRAGLLIGEVAISFVLLIAAGLLSASFLRIHNVEPGFNPQGVFVANIQPPNAQYPDRSEKLVALYSRMIERLSAIPGAKAVALADSPPLSGNIGPAPYEVVGRPIPPLGEQSSALRHIVSPKFFDLLGVRVVQGRDFNERDTPTSPAVAIINQTMANQAFPGQNPIGQRMVSGMMQLGQEIVGVVADTRTADLTTPPQAEMYYPVLQRPEGFTTLMVRTDGDPLLLAPAVRAAVGEVDPALPLANIASMSQWLEQSTADRRLTLMLLGVFAGLALVLASLGVYSVIAYSVGQRSGEIGVRMAMGARPGDVQKMVVKQGLTLTGAGVVLGAIGALALTRLMQTLLFETGAADPGIYLSITAMLTLVAFAACWFPARRAAMVDPLRALRSD